MVSSSFMDSYFLDTHLPSSFLVDAYVSQTSQSIIIEISTWVVLYLLYASIMPHCVRYICSQRNFWYDGIHKRSGAVCANAQDDFIIIVVWGLHHFTAGTMCLLGILYDDANMFRHGYLLEVGFEIADVLSMIFKLYPFTTLDNVKSDVQCGLIFHHLSGILFSGVFLNAGFIHNEHFRMIAFVLLCGAALSMFFGGYIYTLDLQQQLYKFTFLYIFSTAIWCYCRFYIFPMESYMLIQQVHQDQPELSGTWTVTFMYLSYCFYTLFSIGITIDIGTKCIRLIKRCFDGVTPFDVDEVPPSREERIMMMHKQQQKQQQRRNSGRGRSSLSTEQLCMAIMKVDEALLSTSSSSPTSGGYSKAIRRSFLAIKDRSKKLM